MIIILELLKSLVLYYKLCKLLHMNYKKLVGYLISNKLYNRNNYKLYYNKIRNNVPDNISDSVIQMICMSDYVGYILYDINYEKLSNMYNTYYKLIYNETFITINKEFI